MRPCPRSEICLTIWLNWPMTQFGKKTHRARVLLLQAGQDYPLAWSQADAFRADRGQPGFDWPDWCFLPMGGAYAIVSGGGVNRLGLDRIGDVARMSALIAWRMTQGIYRFDPAVYAAVIDTPVSGDLPGRVLMQLPEWCVYVETPGFELSIGQLHGFYAHLEYDANNGHSELRLLLDLTDRLVPIPLHLGDWPLAESVAKASDVAGVHAVALGVPFAAGDSRREHISWAEPLVSLLLYLCSAADFSRRGQPGQPANPQPTRTRRDGWKLFAAQGPAEWDVGVRMGSALRAAYQAAETAPAGGEGASPRGHIRRAHWHGYWSGPLKDGQGDPVPSDKRKFDLRWQPPVAVNLGAVDGMPSVIRPVK